MNKLISGAIAGSAGVAPLPGSAGTFALWSSTAVVNGGSNVAGTQEVADAGSAATWTANGTAVSVANFKVMSGHVNHLNEDHLHPGHRRQSDRDA